MPTKQFLRGLKTGKGLGAAEEIRRIVLILSQSPKYLVQQILEVCCLEDKVWSRTTSRLRTNGERRKDGSEAKVWDVTCFCCCYLSAESWLWPLSMF